MISRRSHVASHFIFSESPCWIAVGRGGGGTFEQIHPLITDMVQ